MARVPRTRRSWTEAVSKVKRTKRERCSHESPEAVLNYVHSLLLLYVGNSEPLENHVLYSCSTAYTSHEKGGVSASDSARAP
jgi:hypothetical protein